MPKKHYGKPFNEYKKPSGKPTKKPTSKPSKSPSKPTAKKPPKRIVKSKPKDGVDLSGQSVVKRSGKRKVAGSKGVVSSTITNRQKMIAKRVAKMFKNKKR